MAKDIKLTKSNTKKLRKYLKTSPSAENMFITAVLNEINKELGVKFKNAETLEDIENALANISLYKLNKLIKNLSTKLLKRNRDGYEGVLNALVQGLAQNAMTRREEKLFKKRLPSYIKEERIYKPLLDKFNYNMTLIKNIPQEMVDLLRKGYFRGEGLRNSDIAKLIEDKMKNRARLITRTESSKLGAALTEVRSKSMGIKCYVWSTSEDQRVRPSHKMVDNVLFFWNDVPSLDKMRGHAGEFPNCRCIGAPVFDIDDIKFPVKVAHNLVIESKYNKQTKKSVAKITGGSITTYTKDKFIAEFKKLFLAQ